MSHPARRRFAAGLFGLLACLFALSPSAASASAGSYTYMLCANPDTGLGTGTDGVFPDGVSMTTAGHVAMTALQSHQRCSDTIDGTRGMIIKPNGSYTLGESTGTTMTLTLPDDLRFVGASVFMRTSTMTSMVASLLRSSDGGVFASPAYYRCEQYGWNCTGTGSTVPFAAGNRFNVGSAHSGMPNGFKWFLRCGWTFCSVSDATTSFSMYGSKVTIADDADPSGSLGVGRLATRDVLSSEVEASFSASDGESGVYRARLLIDDQPEPWFVVDGGSPTCRDNNFGNSDDYEFGVRRPCPSSANGIASLDTTRFTDGTHNLKLVVEDASGRQVRLMDREVTIDNISPPTATSAPTISGAARRASSLFASSGSWDNGGAAGEPTVAHSWERCRRDGSACSVIPGAQAPLYLPGDADINRRLRTVVTASNSEGAAESRSVLTAVVTREDGTLPDDNNDLDDDGDGQVDEPGEQKPAPAGPQTPTTDSASSIGAKQLTGSKESAKSSAPTGDAGAGAGTINGEGASAQARLAASFPKGAAKTTLAFGRSVAITGRLVNERGEPIRNAIVDVAETPALNGARAASGRPAVTGPDGSFTYAATSGAGTRTITFLYRYQREGAVVADATVQLVVRAGVQLKVSLKGIVAKYSGRVRAGSMPRGGKLVLVQGRVKGGRWQTFAARRAGPRGAFKGQYRLKVRRPGRRLQFRARILTEAGWNFGPVTSKAVTRRVR